MNKDAIFYGVLIIVFALLASGKSFTTLVTCLGVAAFGYMMYYDNIRNKSSDQQEPMMNSLNQLREIRSTDVGDHDQIVRNIEEFTKLYKQILLGQKHVERNIDILIDTRRNTLNLLYGYHTKLRSKPLSYLDGIIADISSSTYRYLNILKVKYKIRESMFPGSYNQSSEHDII